MGGNKCQPDVIRRASVSVVVSGPLRVPNTRYRRGRAVESWGNVPLARKRSSERIAMALRSRHVTAEEGELAMLQKRPRRLS